VSGNLDKSGPNLSGILGRKVATAEYRAGYSEALSKSGISWNESALMEFLASPAKMLPGTTMTFIGMRNKTDRRDLVCFLGQY
jgi:cytochrome c